MTAIVRKSAHTTEPMRYRFLFFHMHNGLLQGTHIECVKHFCHRHGQKCHGHTVCTLCDFPDTGFHKMTDNIGKKGNQCNSTALKYDLHVQAVGKQPFTSRTRRPPHQILHPPPPCPAREQERYPSAD